MTDAISDAKLRELKQYVRDNSKNHIPFILVGECLHGIMHPEGTIFPQSIAMGATFNKELMGEVASTIGKEAHALGYTQVLAPDVDIARDARWSELRKPTVRTRTLYLNLPKSTFKVFREMPLLPHLSTISHTAHLRVD